MSAPNIIVVHKIVFETPQSKPQCELCIYSVRIVSTIGLTIVWSLLSREADSPTSDSGGAMIPSWPRNSGPALYPRRFAGGCHGSVLSGIPCLAWCHRDPILDNRKITDGWMDG